MGMFSEISAEFAAKDFESILLQSIKEYEQKDEYDECRGEVILFCRRYVYPIYLNTLSDAWRGKTTPDEKLIKEFYDRVFQ
jgi:hypothetical protein